MQEHIEERMLSRAYSYDMLGSFVAMPLGQLVYGPLGSRIRLRGRARRPAASSTVAIALLTLSSASVRNLRRAS